MRVCGVGAVFVVLGAAACAVGDSSGGSFGFTGDPVAQETDASGDDSADDGPQTSGITNDPESGSDSGGSTDAQTSGDSSPTTGAESSGGGPPPECGDGIAHSSEACDGDDFGGQDCTDFGFDEGVLTCDDECGVLTEGCSTCGDGTKALAEACDGADFGGETCESQGFAGGALQCAPDCSQLDTSSCDPLPTCGDGIQNGTEDCDGADLGGETCVSLGYDLGSLSCNAGSCTHDTTGCDFQNCGGQGDFCLFDEDNPQSTCCDPGVDGIILGICVIAVCQ